MSRSARRHIYPHPLRCVSDQILWGAIYYLLHTTAMSCTLKIIFAKDGWGYLALFIPQFYIHRQISDTNTLGKNLSHQIFPLWRHVMWLVGRVILFLTSWYVSLGYPLFHPMYCQLFLIYESEDISQIFLSSPNDNNLKGKSFNFKTIFLLDFHLAAVDHWSGNANHKFVT